jgi:hypothetical protein
MGQKKKRRLSRIRIIEEEIKMEKMWNIKIEVKMVLDARMKFNLIKLKKFNKNKKKIEKIKD